MIAFAGNSLLCRAALLQTDIDPATFTSARLVSGALAVAVLVRLRNRNPDGSASWRSALALFAYAAAFSFAYATLPVATGAVHIGPQRSFPPARLL